MMKKFMKICSAFTVLFVSVILATDIIYTNRDKIQSSNIQVIVADTTDAASLKTLLVISSLIILGIVGSKLYPKIIDFLKKKFYSNTKITKDKS